HPECVAVFATVNDGKVMFTARCGKAALTKGANAGKLLSAIAPIVGGGGGGRPDSASCGGKCPEKLGEAIDAVDGVIKTQIGE
ncbi:MAG: alanine--tRNA ligase, partial [Clostridia bacterium]|nr:alanine--tRNA ligase [Clostridia bacterium]